jgi:hypothetical protein
MEPTVESNLHVQLQGSCALGRNAGSRPGPHVNINQFENTDTNRETSGMGTSRRAVVLRLRLDEQ